MLGLSTLMLGSGAAIVVKPVPFVTKIPEVVPSTPSSKAMLPKLLMDGREREPDEENGLVDER